MKNKRILAVIPARMKSSRFPGKPLADLCGKPMIIWVCEAVSKSTLVDKVIVATDSEEIANLCKQHNFYAVITSQDHKTGTDRVAEVARKERADIYVNIQGDEPLIEPQAIDKAISAIIKDNDFEVVNLCTEILDLSDLNNVNVPKVVMGVNNRAIFFSRSPIPYLKSKERIKFYRQICVYVFTEKALMSFSEFKQGPAEKAEEIEILRFLEYGIPVKMVEIKTRSFGIDTPPDLVKANKIIKEAL